MAMQDVIRDLSTYFRSLGHDPQMSVHMGGHVNPSYFEAKYRGKSMAVQFWSVSPKSEDEKKLAIALRDDIEEWLTKP